MKKMEHLKKITDPGGMMQQLMQLRAEKSCVKKQHESLIMEKTTNDLKLSSVERGLEALKKDNTLLRNDKSLMQSNHDKELETANEWASLSTQGKALLEAEVKEIRENLTKAESVRAADKVAI